MALAMLDKYPRLVPGLSPLARGNPLGQRQYGLGGVSTLAPNTTTISGSKHRFQSTRPREGAT